MSIQDDVFDVQAALDGKPEAEAFERICEYLARIEKREDEAEQKLSQISAGLRALKELS